MKTILYNICLYLWAHACMCVGNTKIYTLHNNAYLNSTNENKCMGFINTNSEL